jgi:hypothetical protein
MAWRTLFAGNNHLSFDPALAMKPSTYKIAAVLALVACTCFARLSAAPIVLGADDLLGTVFKGTPADPVNALRQVNFLVTKYNLGIADGTALGDNPDDPQTENYTLYRPDNAPASPLPGLALAVAAPAVTPANGLNPVIDLGGFTYQYALFFQANKVWVYYIGDISGSNSIKWGGHPFQDSYAGPSTNGTGLSHYYLFNPSEDVRRVPDNGTAIALLGAGLLVVAIIRRRVGSN